MVAQHQSRVVLLHDVAGDIEHVDHRTVDGVHLGVELQAGHAVADVHERCGDVLLNDLLPVLQRRQQDDSRIGLQEHVALFLEVVVIGAVFLLGVEGLAALLQHLFDLLGNLLLELLHDLDGRLHTDGIPGLEGPQLMVVAPLHGVVDAHDGLADLRHAVGRVDEVVAQVFPRQLGGRVLAEKDSLNRGRDAVVRFLLCFGDGFVLRLGRSDILHRVVVQDQLRFLALGVLGLLVEPLLGLVPQPLELHHLVKEGQRNEKVAALVLGDRLVEVLHHVIARIETDQIEGPED